MRELFQIMEGDPSVKGPDYVRPSVRAVIIRDGRVAMVHSRMYDYYKFPGGGIDEGETQPETLIRETREEAGLVVKPESIREYGLVHREIFRPEERFVQDNFYYLAEVFEETVDQELDDYEDIEGFSLEWARPEDVIRTNEAPGHGPKDPQTLLREAGVLKLLMEEGYFGSEA